MDKFILSKSDLDRIKNNVSIGGFNNLVQPINHSAMESVHKNREEKIAREKRSIELQEIIVEQNNTNNSMKKLELEYLKSMSEDTGQIVNLIKNLETINSANGKVSEENMLEIRKRLEELIKNTNSENMYELFINEVKSQLVEKGVSFGFQFLLTGLKALLVKETST